MDCLGVGRRLPVPLHWIVSDSDSEAKSDGAPTRSANHDVPAAPGPAGPGVPLAVPVQCAGPRQPRAGVPACHWQRASASAPACKRVSVASKPVPVCASCHWQCQCHDVTVCQNDSTRRKGTITCHWQCCAYHLLPVVASLTLGADSDSNALSTSPGATQAGSAGLSRAGYC